MAGWYLERNADLSTSSQRKAQLLKNQNMLSATHLSSRKCPDFRIHYNGNCSGKITLSEMSSNIRGTCVDWLNFMIIGRLKSRPLCERKSTGNWHKHLVRDVTLNVRESFVLLLGICLKWRDALNRSTILQVKGWNIPHSRTPALQTQSRNG